MTRVKIFTGMALFLFFTAVVSIFTATLLSRSNNQSAGISNTLTGISKDTAEPLLTLEEVAKHNQPTDCWMVIEKSVYNFSPYISGHPGGAEAIIPYCGSDGTAGFTTKDKNPAASHSSLAQSLLNSYLIGPLVSTGNSGNTPTSTLPPQPTPIPQKQITLSLAEVAKHNRLTDCWIIVSGKVYDVTQYIRQHPGGASIISNMCGKESTTAFQTKGSKGSNHSGSAYSLLGNYFIGNLNATMISSPASSLSQSPTPLVVNPEKYSEEEDED